MKERDLTGMKVGCLEVIAFDIERYNKDKNRKHNGEIRKLRRYWLCKCDVCGGIHSIFGERLKDGRANECPLTFHERSGKQKQKKNEILSNENGILKMRSSNSDDIIIIDSDKYELISGYCWLVTKRGYVSSSAKKANRGIRLHRFLMFGTEDCKNNLVVDHINHDPLDNRCSNLRVCTQLDNTHNSTKHRNNTSGHIGVSCIRTTGKWRAWVSANRKTINLGNFDTKEEAIAARLAGEKKYYGEFAPSLN